MTYNNFKNLSENEQADCLWDKGLPVGKYDAGTTRFVLYQVDEFYVEVTYQTDFMEMVTLTAFQISNIPEIYLAQVNISGIKH